MTDQEYLEHFGKIGMKWGKRKAMRAQKSAEALTRRQGITDRIKKENPEEFKKLQEVARRRGASRTNRIIDIMGKQPGKSVKLAARKEMGERLLRQWLVGPMGNMIIERTRI